MHPQWDDLGTTNLEYVVDLGPQADHSHHYGIHLYCLYSFAAQYGRTQRAQFSAIYAIIGFVTVPLTFFSARLLRTIHPVIFGSGEVDMNLNQPMLTTMFISLGAFTVMYVALLLQRTRLMQAEETLMQLRLQTEIDADWEDQANA